METTAAAAISPTTAAAAEEEIPETKAEAGTGTETGMIPAGKEVLIRSRHPAALADARKKSPREAFLCLQ